MWYRIAQNKFNYNITQEQNFLKISLRSPVSANGVPEYPTINIYQSLPGAETVKKIESSDNSILKTFKNLAQNEINQIMITVMNVFALYPKGALSKIAAKGLDINIGLEVGSNHTFFGYKYTSPFNGLKTEGPDQIWINYNFIKDALNHELGHAIDPSVGDMKKLFFNPSEKNKYLDMAPSGYARNNKWEAFAEGFDILSKKGFDYKFPETSEQNIRQNQLLDIVRKQIKQNPSNFKDFGSDIKFDSLQQKGQLDENSYKTNDYKAKRLSILVGAFQNAVDKFSGDKNQYAKKLVNDQQKIKDIVGFLNKNEYFFSVEPVTKDEIDLALYRFSLSSDKSKDPSSYNFNNYTFKDRVKNNPINQHIDNFYLPKKIKDFIEQHLDIYEKSRNDKVYQIINGKPYNLFPDTDETRYFESKLIPEAIRYFMPSRYPNKSDMKNIPQVSVLDQMAPVDELQYKIGQKIINAISTKDSKYIDNQANVDRIYQQLITSIFPPLTFNNPEDYFLYDFQISSTSSPTIQSIQSPNQVSSTSFSLDQDIVKQKINQVMDQDEFSKNLSSNVKQKISNDLFIRIMSLKEKYANLIQNNPKLKINFQTALKAIDKLLASNIKLKNQFFMRIYNLNKWTEKQKQELLNYYRSKQNQSVKK